RDIESGQVVAVCRVHGGKIPIPMAEAAEKIQELFGKQQAALMKRAQEIMDQAMVEIKECSEFKEGTVAKTGWCGSEDCGHQIEEMTGGAILGTPVPEEKVPQGTQCCVCGAAAPQWIYIAKTH
ncbi:MAG: hypothetical protein QCI38_04930, partial [Candidatus Thermoplasmatota archaeon]|nr:hypothetical protein [Candidatus Thermoplasmatota archaeon]